MGSLSASLAAVHARIEATGRAVDSVRLVAVTKGFGPEAVVAAAEVGLVDCGENQAQSLLAKAGSAPPGTQWHFLGPVQRNKVKALAAHVSVWHGIDRLVAAESVARHQPGAAVFVQVNLTGDPGRPGCDWDGTDVLVASAVALGLEVRGLMGVASRDLIAAREQFRGLARVAQRTGVAELSMGMSGDLEVALEEGATMVRVGTALFGARPRPLEVRR
ncbi:MAG: YggS family pyridoxal phosphate-dependent enzyme [Actinomycetota bacterium]|nr:YggS family pyridoxal phosphate-dependent enzyme [Actinomycetota bacterium]